MAIGTISFGTSMGPLVIYGYYSLMGRRGLCQVARRFCTWAFTWPTPIFCNIMWKYNWHVLLHVLICTSLSKSVKDYSHCCHQMSALCHFQLPWDPSPSNCDVLEPFLVALCHHFPFSASFACCVC